MDDPVFLIGDLLPPMIALSGGRTIARGPSLYAEEEAVIANAVARRRNEFRCGREHARRALRALGYPAGPIPVGTSRQPLWPTGIIGSITHSEGFVATVVAWRVDYCALGIDFESSTPLVRNLIPLICDNDELASIATATPLRFDLPKLLFVIKEAVFKAYFPATGSFLDFKDVAVTLDTATLSFEAMLKRGETPALFGYRHLKGKYGFSWRFLAAVLAMPASTDSAAAAQ